MDRSRDPYTSEIAPMPITKKRSKSS